MDLSKETLVYTTKIKPIGSLVLFSIFLIIGILLGVKAFSSNGNQLIVLSIMGLITVGYSGYHIKKALHELLTKEVQIKMTSIGMSTISAPFKSWASIKNIKLVTDLSKSHHVYYLEYIFPGGKESLLINNLTIAPKEIERLVLEYKNESKTEPVEEKYAAPKSDKDEMMRKFFEKE